MENEGGEACLIYMTAPQCQGIILTGSPGHTRTHTHTHTHVRAHTHAHAHAHAHAHTHTHTGGLTMA